MPLREENGEEEREKERSVCRKLSLPCSTMGVLNTAKHLKVRFGTGRGAQWNDLYFTSGCEYGYRSPPLFLFFLSSSNSSRCCRVSILSFFSTCEDAQEAGAPPSPVDCWDVIALTEGDSSCHGCQTARPAAYQTAGYTVTGDMLNQPLKRNHCQLYMAADSQSS